MSATSLISWFLTSLQRRRASAPAPTVAADSHLPPPSPDAVIAAAPAPTVATDLHPPPPSPDAIIAALEARVGADTGDLDAWWELAHRYAQVGNYRAAEAAYKHLLAADDDQRRTMTAYGQFLCHVGRLDEAIDSFLRAVRRDRADGDAWIGLANALHGVGQAKTLFDKIAEVARSLRPGDPTGSNGLAQAYRDRSRLIIGDLVDDLLPQDERFVVIDGGARDALADPRWLALTAARLTIHGFEPDTAECERLNLAARERGLDVHFHAAGLWSSNGVMPFEDNNIGGGSSLLKQNRAVTDRWKFENPDSAVNASDIFFPVRTIATPVTTITDWAAAAGVGKIDFIKLNVQGAELDILRGCAGLIDGVIGILAEVAFVESYEDRPMFADVDPWLRREGFVFFDLLAHHYVGRAASPLAGRHWSPIQTRRRDINPSWGQLIEGHALYLRDPIGAPPSADTLLGTVATRTLKLACFAELFGQIEYAFELLVWLKRRVEATDPTLAQRLEGIFDEATRRYRKLVSET